MTIVNDDSSVISKWSFKLIDDPRVVIYDRHKFKVQATGVEAQLVEHLNVDPKFKGLNPTTDGTGILEWLLID